MLLLIRSICDRFCLQVAKITNWGLVLNEDFLKNSFENQRRTIQVDVVRYNKSNQL